MRARQRIRARSRRDPLKSEQLHALLMRVRAPFQKPGTFRSGIEVHLNPRELEAGLVLGDALEERGFTQLGRQIQRTFLKIIRESENGTKPASAPSSLRFLLKRAQKAIRELDVDPETISGRWISRARRGLSVPDRRLLQSSAFLRQRYDFWRKRGASIRNALQNARAEAYASRHGWNVQVEPEQERYQDVYGYSQENATIEREHEFFWVQIFDSRQGENIDSLGMIASNDVPEEAARMIWENMPERAKRPPRTS